MVGQKVGSSAVLLAASLAALWAAKKAAWKVVQKAELSAVN
jgi:hypothetical protein